MIFAWEDRPSLPAEKHRCAGRFCCLRGAALGAIV